MHVYKYTYIHTQINIREKEVAAAKETIAALHQDLHRTSTVKMQEKEDYETTIASLRASLHQGINIYVSMYV